MRWTKWCRPATFFFFPFLSFPFSAFSFLFPFFFFLGRLFLYSFLPLPHTTPQKSFTPKLGGARLCPAHAETALILFSPSLHLVLPREDPCRGATSASHVDYLRPEELESAGLVRRGGVAGERGGRDPLVAARSVCDNDMMVYRGRVDCL